jgi:hypothetical protein
MELYRPDEHHRHRDRICRIGIAAYHSPHLFVSATKQERCIVRQRRANKRAAGKGGIAALLHAVYPYPALPEHGRWAKARLRCGVLL